MKKRTQKTTTHPGALNCFKCASRSKMQWLKKLLASCFFPPQTYFLIFFAKLQQNFVFQSLEQTPLEFNFSSKKALQICKICGLDVLFPSPSSSCFFSWLLLTCGSCERVPSEVVWVVLVFLFLFFLLSVFCESLSLPQCVAACFHTHSVFLLSSELTQAKC